MEVKLLNPEDCVNAFEKIGRFAAVCKGGANYEAIGKQCLESGHWSAVRTVQLNFYIGGASRVLTHQLVRHKIGVEINQQSQRSVTPEIGTFIVPKSMQGRPEIVSTYNDLCKQAWILYKRWLIEGIPAEDARYILPQSITTELNIQFSLQALVHFCHERLCRKAQWEIRELAERLRSEVAKYNPTLTSYLMPKCEYLHRCPEKQSCGRYQC